MTVPPPICKICGEDDISKFRVRSIAGKSYYVKQCRSCEAKLSRAYYADHKNERIAYQDTYRKENKEVIKQKKSEYDKNRYPSIKDDKAIYDKEYRENNKVKINTRKRNKRKSDPVARLQHYVSTRVRKIIKKLGGIKNGSVIKHLDYSFVQLKDHLEKQFEPWMNWDNHRIYNINSWDENDSATWTWSLDHIIPQSDLPYASMTDDNFKKCWALDNLRPLSAKQNYLDGINRVRHGK